LSILLAVILLLVLAVAAGVIWNEPLKSVAERLYQAIARPTVRGSEPTMAGHRHGAGGAGQAAEEKHQYYTCGMHPWVILPKPGDCPICHMKLVPLDPAKFTKEIAINPVMTQNIGVRVSPVVTGPVTQVVRTVGTVDYDETLVRDVNLKISGWVEKLYVNAIGQPVEKNQLLLEIYSPDLYTAQVDYLLAFKGKDLLKNAPPSDVATMDADLLAAARKRLEYFDISPQQIEELEKSGKASKTMTLRSRFRGTVVGKNVFDGQKVDAGMQLLRIADLSRVWIMVTIYEYQIPYIEVGQKAVMSLPYMPGQVFEGKVTYIYPYLNPELRQAKVRLEFDNPGLFLKPGMFAKVELHRTLATDRTLVPREAVIDTGIRQIAFVSRGEGRFEPREVQVGVEAEGGMLEILDGLKPGEMVVTSSEFLLDSEARLREALAKMVKGTAAAEQKAEAAVAGTSELAALPDAAAKALSAILDGYLATGDRLSNDAIEGLTAPARQIAENVNALVEVLIPDDEHFWHRHMETGDIRGRALEIIDAKDLAQARQKFADLSVALRKLLRATGVPPAYGKEVQELHCPMYREKQGGTIWMQTAGEVHNPYYGKAMLGCFDTRFSLPVTSGKAEGQKPKLARPSLGGGGAEGK
jgi:multidrug efflux pump subunit AcrA (membrane-fusion protein)